MTTPIRILVGLGLAVAVVALAISLASVRPGLSMSLVEYKRWPHGAMVRLTNGTHATSRYLAEHNGTPAGSPILCVQKASNGWTTASVAVRIATFRAPGTGKTNEVFFLVDPAALPKPSERIELLLTRDLRPGQSVEFFISLEPGAPPKRIGTICFFEQSKLMGALQPWLLSIKRWGRIKTTLPGQVKVWCPTSLYMSSS